MAVQISYQFNLNSYSIDDSPYDFDRPTDTVVLSSGQVVSISDEAVAQLGNGNVVTVDGNVTNGIYYRISSPDGSTSSFGTFGTAGETAPDVATFTGAAAGFVVVDEKNVSSTSTPDHDIYAHFRNADGTAGPDQTIVSGSTDDFGAKVVLLKDGGFAVAWQRQVGTATQLWAAVYESGGSVRTAPHLIDGTGSINREPSLVALPSGGFAIAYTTDGPTSTTTSITVALLDAQGGVTNSIAATSGTIDASQPGLATTINGYLVATYTAGPGIEATLIDPSSGTVLSDPANPIFLDDGVDARPTNSSAASGAGIDLALTDSTAYFDDSGFDAGFYPVLGVGTYTLVRNTKGDDADNTLQGDDLVDVMSGAGGADKLYGAGGNDVLDGGAGDDLLDGGTGTNTASYASVTAGVRVDLSIAGPQQTLGAGKDTLVNIQNLVGSASNDTLSGDDAANVLDGGAGNDRLDGRGGADTMRGGAGSDTYYVDDQADVVVEDYTAGGIDTVYASVDYRLGSYVGIETLAAGPGALSLKLTGNELANRIVGSDGDDVLSGEGGNDTLVGGKGDDTLDGGTGIDTADYANATKAVVVDLSLTTAQVTGGAGTDTLANIENLTGSAFNDTLTGDGFSNVLSGGIGNDKLNGGGGSDILRGGDGNDSISGGTGNDILDGGLGNDLIDGGADLDTVNYASATAGVRVNLAVVAYQNTGAAGLDKLINIEAVTGSAFADTLRGDGGDNRLSGGAGDDTLLGNDGNDLLDGGAGDDKLDGGAGTDSVSYAAAASGVTVDLRVTTAQATGGGGTDTITNVESVIGSNFNDVLTGTAGVNRLYGNDGDDQIDGGAGADFMYGGLGRDTYIVDDPGDRVVEVANLASDPVGSLDAVRSSVSFVLPNYVERLSLTGTGAVNATGNSLDNILIGNASANVLEGKAGKDVLTGGGGADTFVYHAGFGLDEIKDFAAGTAAAHDTIQIDKSLFADYAELMQHTVDSGANAIISLDATNKITIDNVAKADLVSADFKFV